MNRVHEPYVAPEQIIDFPHSIAGQTIRNNRRSDESTSNGNLPRFHREEMIGSTGVFLSVPLSSVNKCYGCVNLERTEKIPFTAQDLKMLSHLVNFATSYFEVLYMNDLIEEYVIIDDVTGVASKKFFLQRVEEELGRANDNSADLSLLLISVDRAPELLQRFAQEGFNRIMLSLAKVIRSSVRTYDIAGRMGDDRLGVVLINTPANDAYLWSEKIRKNVSGQTIEIDGKSFSVTISAGVVGATENVTREELLNNTLAVLNKAIAAGGNAVRVF
jgi:diguanylate cyclase (GGDEF)-like protein